MNQQELEVLGYGFEITGSFYRVTHSPVHKPSTHDDLMNYLAVPVRAGRSGVAPALAAAYNRALGIPQIQNMRPLQPLVQSVREAAKQGLNDWYKAMMDKASYAAIRGVSASSMAVDECTGLEGFRTVLFCSTPPTYRTNKRRGGWVRQLSIKEVTAICVRAATIDAVQQRFKETT